MSTLDAVRQLIRQGYRARPEDLADMAMQAAPLLGVDALVIYVVDHQQRVLLPLLSDRLRTSAATAIDGTLAGRAYSTLVPVRGPSAAGEEDGLGSAVGR